MYQHARPFNNRTKRYNFILLVSWKFEMIDVNGRGEGDTSAFYCQRWNSCIYWRLANARTVAKDHLGGGAGKFLVCGTICSPNSSKECDARVLSIVLLANEKKKGGKRWKEGEGDEGRTEHFEVRDFEAIAGPWRPWVLMTARAIQRRWERQARLPANFVKISRPGTVRCNNCCEWRSYKWTSGSL